MVFIDQHECVSHNTFADFCYFRSFSSDLGVMSAFHFVSLAVYLFLRLSVSLAVYCLSVFPGLEMAAALVAKSEQPEL